MEDNDLSLEELRLEEEYKSKEAILPPAKSLDPRKEHISDVELNRIKALQTKAAYAAMLAEKTYAEAKVAELEAVNFTLTIYNKYKLISGKDSITNDGLIMRTDDTVQSPEV